MKKVLITGANGQLGKDVSILFKNLGYAVIDCDRTILDVTDIQNVNTVLSRENPDIVIHAAAYTDVNAAETNPELTYSVNAYGTRNVAVCSEAVGAKLVYISTDYVFNGKSNKPINEFEVPDPINIYGKSKLGGEQFVRNLHSKFFVVRTSWLYGKHGDNFVKTMLKLSQEKTQLSVVNDQIGCPTYTVDLAHFLYELIQTNKYGIYHASNSGQCSWFEFAQTIFKSKQIEIDLKPVSSNEYPQIAERPYYSVFDQMAIRLNGFVEMRTWKISLKDFLLTNTQ